MGCIMSSQSEEANSSCPGGQHQHHRQRRPSLQMRHLNRSLRMGSVRHKNAESCCGQQQPLTPQGSTSRRSSLANLSKTHAVCPELCNYEFSRKDHQHDLDDYFSDCAREQKRNEFEDFGTSPHLTLGAYDRLEFDMTPMERREDAFF